MCAARAGFSTGDCEFASATDRNLREKVTLETEWHRGEPAYSQRIGLSFKVLARIPMGVSGAGCKIFWENQVVYKQ
jgi:hypothetical protein